MKCMKSGKWIFLVVAAVFVVIAAVFIFTAEVENGEVENVGGNTNTGVEIQSEFSDKLVYTTDSLADTAPLVEHCEAQGGIFNACGSICGPEAEICAAVCAFTCEFESS
jgi:hypothetical protein